MTGDDYCSARPLSPWANRLPHAGSECKWECGHRGYESDPTPVTVYSGKTAATILNTPTASAVSEIMIYMALMLDVTV